MGHGGSKFATVRVSICFGEAGAATVIADRGVISVIAVNAMQISLFIWFLIFRRL